MYLEELAREGIVKVVEPRTGIQELASFDLTPTSFDPDAVLMEDATGDHEAKQSNTV